MEIIELSKELEGARRREKYSCLYLSGIFFSPKNQTPKQRTLLIVSKEPRHIGLASLEAGSLGEV